MYFDGLVDIMLTYDQDIEFDNGDIKLTRGLDLIKRDMYNLLISDPGDWKLYPLEGASPNKFTGEPNTRDTAEQIERYISSKLERVTFPSTLKVKVIPTSNDTVMVFLTLYMFGETIDEVSLSFDYINGLVYNGFDDVVDEVISSDKIQINDPVLNETYNKYWDRIRLQ